MKILGIIIAMIGGACLAASLNMSTTVVVSGGRFGISTVHNIGLMNEKNNYVIASSVVLVIGVGLFLCSMYLEKTKTRDRSSPSPVVTGRVVYETSPASASSTNRKAEFSGNKSLENDMYKIYLAEKYEVTRNELFQKYVWNGSMYDDLSALLHQLHMNEAAASDRKTSGQITDKISGTITTTDAREGEGISEPNQSRIDATKFITALGYQVEYTTDTRGEVWTIKENHFKIIAKFRSLEAFVDYAESLKNGAQANRNAPPLGREWGD